MKEVISVLKEDISKHDQTNELTQNAGLEKTVGGFWKVGRRERRHQP